MADLLCTVAQVKLHAGIPDAADDALITELIEECSDWIQDTIKRKLVPEPAATYVVDTSAGSVINVRRGIRTVTALGIAQTNQPDAGGVYAAVSLSEVVLRPMAIDRRPGWPAERIMLLGSAARLGRVINGAQITGDFGFAVTPPSIVAVTIDAVVTAYTAKTAGASDVIGADDASIFPWARYFSKGSPQRATVERFRGVGMA